MSDEVVVGDQPAKKRKKVEFKRVGPPCNPENAPGGCGRPLPVTGVPKEEEQLAKIKARIERDQKRLLVASQSTTVKVPTPEEKAATEAAELEAKLARKAAREAKKAGLPVTPST